MFNKKEDENIKIIHLQPRCILNINHTFAEKQHK